MNDFPWICHDLQDNALSLKLDLYGIRGAPFDFRGGGHGSWGRVFFFFFFFFLLLWWTKVFFNDFIYLFIFFGLTGGSILFIQKLPFCHRISGSGWNFVCLFVCLFVCFLLLRLMKFFCFVLFFLFSLNSGWSFFFSFQKISMPPPPYQMVRPYI